MFCCTTGQLPAPCCTIALIVSRARIRSVCPTCPVAQQASCPVAQWVATYSFVNQNPDALLLNCLCNMFCVHHHGPVAQWVAILYSFVRQNPDALLLNYPCNMSCCTTGLLHNRSLPYSHEPESRCPVICATCPVAQRAYCTMGCYLRVWNMSCVQWASCPVAQWVAIL